MSKYLILFFSFLLLSCGNPDKTKNEQTVYQETYGSVFNTNYSIKYEYTRSLDEEIKQELAKFDDSLNPFKINSIISTVNRNEELEVDSFFVEVFNKAMEVSGKSNGMFDITVAPLINLWGFGFKNMGGVTDMMIDSIKQFVGYEKIWLNGNSIVKADPRVILNMSAIAKGYSTDVISRLLESYGIKNYMVEIGGEISMKGVNPRGKCWTIGIEKPVYDRTGFQSEIQQILQICDKSIATSGDYRNFYIKDGIKYAHTIDPKTGRPAENDILSATVIANDCMTADAYATVFMTVGKDEAMRLVSELNDIYAYFIYRQASDDTIGIVYSDGFEQFLVIERK
jgi:thiamine biosynthesis lipoprotein